MAYLARRLGARWLSSVSRVRFLYVLSISFIIEFLPLVSPNLVGEEPFGHGESSRKALRCFYKISICANLREISRQHHTKGGHKMNANASCTFRVRIPPTCRHLALAPPFSFASRSIGPHECCLCKRQQRLWQRLRDLAAIRSQSRWLNIGVFVCGESCGSSSLFSYVCASNSMLGVNSVQTYLYFQRFRDNRLTQALVSFCRLSDSHPMSRANRPTLGHYNDVKDFAYVSYG